MSMQFLSATQDNSGYHYSIWLDTSKVDVNGKPESAYVKNYDWSPAPASWIGGASAYQAMTLAEVKLLAQDALNQINAPTPTPTNLSVNGQMF